MQLKSIMLAAGVLAFSAGAAAAATVTNDLNLRSGPGTGYRVITSMPAGAYVDVLNCGGSWCRVDWQGTVGYASASYLAGGGGGYAAVPPPVYYAPPPAAVFGFGFGTGPRYYRHRGARHYYRHGGHYGNRGGHHDGSNYRRGGNRSSYHGGGSSRGASNAQFQRAIRNLPGNR